MEKVRTIWYCLLSPSFSDAYSRSRSRKRTKRIDKTLYPVDVDMGCDLLYFYVLPLKVWLGFNRRFHRLTFQCPESVLA